jgi:hypothetical protein
MSQLTTGRSGSSFFKPTYAMRRILAVSALLLLGAVSGASAVSQDVVGLILLHRHGARIPQPSSTNATAICGEICGQLTAQGSQMLFSLGQHIQADYPYLMLKDPQFGSTVQGTGYNPDRTVSHSTDVDRTLQSSQSMVHGLMAAPGSLEAARRGRSQAVHRPVGGSASDWCAESVCSVMPVVHTVSVMNAKQLLPGETNVNVFIHGQLGMDGGRSAMLRGFASALFTEEELALIGGVIGMNDQCLNGTDPAGCVLDAYDFICANLANGQYVDPRLMPLYPRTIQTLQFNNVLYYFSFNATDANDAAIGMLGYPLAAQMVTDFAQADATASQTTPVFIEYSGHDISVMPFTAIVGSALNSTIATNPVFAATYVLELAGQQGNRTVRLRYGTPDQVHDSDHAYTFEYASLTCIPNGGTEPFVADPATGCLLSEWNNYLLTKAPQSPAGECYLSADVMNAMDCLPGNSTTDAKDLPPNPYCGFWRGLCPLWACRQPGQDPSEMPSHFLQPNLACMPVGSSTKKQNHA